MAETLSTLSIISFVIAVIGLIAAVFLWFFFGIPTVIGDLNGHNARKSIARMRAANEKNGTKTYKGSRINMERGKLTETISQPSKPKKKAPKKESERPETGLLAENIAKMSVSATTDLLSNDSTTLLVDKDETVLLPDNDKKGKKLETIKAVMLIHTEEVIE